MTDTNFATAQDAQKAFYEAIQSANLAQMMAVWSTDEDIICIHPGGVRHCGPAEVHESWRQIFMHGPQLIFKIVNSKSHQARMLSIHSVCEQMTHRAGAHPPASAIATNVFARTDHGWKMLLHHASPIPSRPLQEQQEPTVLH